MKGLYEASWIELRFNSEAKPLYFRKAKKIAERHRAAYNGNECIVKFQFLILPNPDLMELLRIIRRLSSSRAYIDGKQHSPRKLYDALSKYSSTVPDRYIEYLNGLIEIEPYDLFYSELAFVYDETLNQPTQAISVLEKGLNHCKTRENLLENLIQLEIGQKNYGKALNYMIELVKLCPYLMEDFQKDKLYAPIRQLPGYQEFLEIGTSFYNKFKKQFFHFQT